MLRPDAPGVMKRTHRLPILGWRGQFDADRPGLVEALGIAVGRGSSDGALFVVGTVGKRYYGSWTVTRSLDGGESWEGVDTAAWVPTADDLSPRRWIVQRFDP